MGEKREKRLRLKKLKKQLNVSRDEQARAKAKVDELTVKQVSLTKELDEVSGEAQAALQDLADEAGPVLFPSPNDEKVARYLIETNDEHDRHANVYGLSRLLDPAIRANEEVCNKAAAIVDDLVDENGNSWRTSASKPWNNDEGGKTAAGQVLSIIYAKRMVDQPKDRFVPFRDMDISKFMTEQETVDIARKATKAFLKSHEENLTGRALAAKKYLDSLNPATKSQLHRGVQKNIKEQADYAKMLGDITGKFTAKWPNVEPSERSVAFMDLFAITREAMPESDKDMPTMDALAFLLASDIFTEGYERAISERSNDDKTKEKVTDAMKVFLRAHESSLSGEALEAKNHLDKLSEEQREQVEFKLAEVAVDRPDYVAKMQAIKDTFHSEFPDIGGQQTKAFARLYELVRAEVNTPGIQGAALAYVVADGIFQDRGIDNTEEYINRVAQPKFTDQALTKIGVELWEKTYKLEKSDADLDSLLEKRFTNQTSKDLGRFAAKWAVHAFQRLTTTHTYAAALMCSDADKTVLQDIEMQWFAFMVLVPNGLFPYRDSNGVESEYNRILVASYDQSAVFILMDQSASAEHCIVRGRGNSLADILDASDTVPDDQDYSENTETVARLCRILVMAKRLVAGLLLAMQNQNNFKQKNYPARAGQHNREPNQEPAHRVVYVGTPLKIDCRPRVMDYIRNGSPKRKGAPPQVQILVRGHFKRQVIGVGRLGRKVIWLQPFWRGKLDAPIFTRPKKLG